MDGADVGAVSKGELENLSMKIRPVRVSCMKRGS